LPKRDQKRPRSSSERAEKELIKVHLFQRGQLKPAPGRDQELQLATGSRGLPDGPSAIQHLAARSPPSGPTTPCAFATPCTHPPAAVEDRLTKSPAGARGASGQTEHRCSHGSWELAAYQRSTVTHPKTCSEDKNNSFPHKLRNWAHKVFKVRETSNLRPKAPWSRFVPASGNPGLRDPVGPPLTVKGTSALQLCMCRARD